MSLENFSRQVEGGKKTLEKRFTQIKFCMGPIEKANEIF